MPEQLDPTMADAAALQHQFNEAVAIYSRGDIAQADKRCAAILDKYPEHAHTLNLLAAIRLLQDRGKEALSLSAQAVKLAPTDAVIWTGRSDVLNRCSDGSAALEAADAAIALNPKLPQAHINRGVALVSGYQFAKAREALLLAQEINPTLKPVVQGNLILLHGEEGQYETARKIADSLAESYPTEHNFAAFRARFSMYTPSVTRAEERQRTAAVWATWPQAVTPLPPPLPKDLSGTRKLRIGYLSADYKNHPVARFLEPVLERHDKTSLETVLYDVTPEDDSFGDTIRQLGDRYHRGLHQTDAQLAEKIRQDEVDILVDLTGYFKDHRLGVFLFRPAPIQMSWIGYSGTSAHPQMDYVIADSYVCPPEADKDFTEEIIRLPDHYLCVDPQGIGPTVPIAQQPQVGRITFGSFNNHKKINVDVVRVWAEILKRVSNSQLFLKGGSFESPVLREHVRRQFEARGIDRSRLRISGHLNAEAHFAAYNEIDIALDPFPYCGTTTTVDALSMGVPMVTLVGERWVQRTSYGFLSGMGWGALCAESEQEYMDIAIGLAHDPQRLRTLRAEGREKFVSSPLCDPKTFTLHLENAFRRVWRAYCTLSANT